MRYQGLV